MTCGSFRAALRDGVELSRHCNGGKVRCGGVARAVAVRNGRIVDVAIWIMIESEPGVRQMADPGSRFGAEFGQGRSSAAHLSGASERTAAAAGELGWREREVLSVLRELGNATVQQVSERLSAGPAYTTVMTTLDRLFRKGLLRREKQNRAFLYSAAVSAEDLEGRRAADLVHRFFSESDAQPEVLVSCLIDAFHEYDTELLDQLESRIRAARAQARPAADAAEKERG